MADHSIRIGIDSSDAERGAARVTASLKSIRDDTAKTVGNGKGISVGIDGSAAEAGAIRVKRSFQEIRALASKLTDKSLSVTLDVAGMQDGVQKVSRTLQQLSGRGETKVSVSTDISEAEGRIKQLLDELAGFVSKEKSIKVPVGADTSQAQEDAKKLGEKLGRSVSQGKSVKIPVGVDGSGVESGTRKVAEAIRAAVDQAKGIVGDGIPIRVDASEMQGGVRDALNSIRSIVERGSSTNAIPVSIDPSKAEQGAKRLRDEFGRFLPRGKDTEIPVGVDPSKAEQGAKRLRDEFGRFLPRDTKIPVGIDPSEAEQGAKRLRDEFGRFLPRGIKIPVGIDPSGAASGASKVRKSLSDIRDEASKTKSSLSDMKGAVAGAVGAFIGLDAIKRFAESTVKANAEFQKLMASLETVTGSARRASTAFETIEKFATETPYTLNQVVEAFIKLKSLGLDATEDSLRSFGNTASAMGKPLNQMIEAVADAVNGETERLKEFGIDASVQGDKIKFTFQGVTTSVNNDSKAIQSYLKGIGDVQFAGGMARQMDTLGGKFSNLGDAVSKFQRLIGEGGLSDALAKFTDLLTKSVDQIGPLATWFGQFTGGILGSFADQMNEAGKELEYVLDIAKKVASVTGLDKLVSNTQSATAAAQDDMAGLSAGDLTNVTGINLPPAPIAPGVFLQQNKKGETRIKPTGLSLTAPDDRDVERVSKSKSQSEALAKNIQQAKEQIKVLSQIDQSYEHGRGSVEQYRNALEDLATKQSAGDMVGKKQAQTLVDLAAKARDMQETIAFKGVKLDMSDNIQQVDALTEAYGKDADEVRHVESAIAAYDKAVQLGMAGTQEAVQSLYDLEQVTAQANAKLEVAKELFNMDIDIASITRMTDGYKQGGDAVRQASIENEAYAIAVQKGVENDADQIAKIQEKVAALHSANEAQAVAEDLFKMDIDISGMTRMIDAYKQGGSAVRDAAIANEAYTKAVQAGVQDQASEVAKIQEKVRAYREMADAQALASQAMGRDFDIEQAEGELRLIDMTGEAREVEAAKLSMLIDKKRLLQDATATLTDEEIRQAEAMGRVSYAASQQNTELARLARSIPDAATAFDMAAAGSLGHFEDALVDIVTGAKSAREAFAGMAKSIAADLARMAIRMAIIQPLAMMFGGGFGGAVAAPVFGGFMSAAQAGPITWAHTGGVIGSDNLPTRTLPAFHTGGVVGSETPMSRTLPAMPSMSSWPKFHGGGLVEGEVPAVLKKGEGVFTAEQMAALSPVNNNTDNRGDNVFNINVSVPSSGQGSGDPGAAERQGKIIARQIQQAMDEHLIKATRNGGILNQNGY